MVQIGTVHAQSYGYGGGGGGGGGSIWTVGGGAANPLPGATVSTGVTTTTTTAPANQGSVLGAAAYNFNSNLTVGSNGADVTALQQFLISGGFSIPAGATGYFGNQTKDAVIAYQKASNLPSTGFVGPLTIALLNKGVIPSVVETTQSSSSSLTATQISSIVSVLQSFNVDPATLAKVEAALGQ